MSHARRVWIAFAASVVVVAAAMGWMTRVALELDRREAEAARLAQDEEAIGLAMWRMDAALTAVIAQEGARPYFHYQSFFAADDIYTPGLAAWQPAAVWIRSPLLGPEIPPVKLHFRIDAAGAVTSPQAPTGGQRTVARRYLSDDALARAEGRLKELRTLLGAPDLLASLPAPPPSTATTRPAPFLNNANFAFERGNRGQIAASEFNMRRQVSQATNSMQFQDQGRQFAWPIRDADVRDGETRSLWIGDALILARRVAVGKAGQVVGCWLDWPAIREQLIESIRDILSEADVAPLRPGEAAEPSRRMAALPLVLKPGAMPAVVEAGWSPMMVSLAAAWGGLALAATALALLLAGTLGLSERRGAFVSAVTHELRTPLTTMRMYTEMLSDGRVADEAKAASYLDTIHAETNRLCRLVENVLTWSRLEGRQRPAEAERVDLAELLDRIAPRLGERAAGAGMEVLVDVAAGSAALADPTGLEQVLFNLVDNACKYAASGADKRIHVSCATEAGSAVIRVCDHGPGIPAEDLAKVFRPFFRAGRDRAGSFGGVGLGLAISRRIVRALGGRLRVESPPDGGACLAVELPLA